MGTIVTLRDELREANEAIDELKEALKNALRQQQEQQEEAEGGSNNAHADGAGGYQSRTSNGGDRSGEGTTPLLYAMEKQAELNTARNEINRLANMLSDVQSEKTTSDEAMEQ